MSVLSASKLQAGRLQRSACLGLWLIVAATAVGIALRIWSIDAKPLWLDEAYSLWFANSSVRYLWNVAPTFETHPPLYYSILHFWIGAFGETERAMRSLSLLVNLAALPVVYLAARTAVTGLEHRFKMAPAIAVAVFALSALQVDFAVEARPYALLGFAYMVAIFGALAIVRSPADLRAWACLVVGMALTCWFHALGPLYVVSLGLALLVSWATTLGRPAHFLRNLVVSAIAVALLYLPIVPSLLSRASNWSNETWVVSPSFKAVGGVFIDLYGIDLPLDLRLLTYPLTLGLCGLACLGFARLVRTHFATGVVLTFAWALPFLISLALSLTVTPVFLTRTLIGTAAPFIILLSLGACTLRPRWRNLIAVAVLAAFCLSTVLRHAEAPREDWRGVSQFLAKSVGPRDVVLTVPNSASLPLDYYLREAGVPFRSRPLPKPFPALGLPNPYPSGQVGEPGMTERDSAQAVTALEQRPAPVIWLVLRAPDLDPNDTIQGQLSKRRHRTTYNFGPISVEAYRLPRPATS